MAYTLIQKQNFVVRTMSLARECVDLQKKILAFTEERVANDLGNVAVITDANIDTVPIAADLTQAEFSSGIGAIEAVGTAVTANKTNLYKVAKGTES